MNNSNATIQQQLSDKGSTTYLVSICFITTIGGFLFGYDTAIIAGCNSFLESHFQLSKTGLGWAASSALLGTIVGSFFAGHISDSFGRKPTLILAAWFLIISAVGSALPPIFLGRPDNFPWLTSDVNFAFNFLVIARLIGGVGVGITYAVSPLYIAEITPPKNRGKMVSIYQLSITLGILLAFVIDYLILHTAGKNAGTVTAQWTGSLWQWMFSAEIWRGMFGSEVPVAILFLLGLVFIAPESPRWLVAKGKESKAVQILCRIVGRTQAQKELDDIHAVLNQEGGRFSELFQPYLRIPLLIGILLPMFSHLSGIAAIMYFAPNILNASMHSAEGSFLGAVLVGVVNSVFTFIAIWKIDHFGRRPLLLAGVTGAFVSLAAVGILFMAKSCFVLIPLLMYVACFAFSYGPVLWTLMGEIFPTRIRGRAGAMGAFSLSITSFVITQTNPMLFEKISPAGTFFVYAGLTLPAIWFVWKYIPETKGKTLEEIEQTWLKKKKSK